MKLEKLANEDANEEFMSTVKFETSNKNDSNFEGSTVWSCC